MKMPAPILIVEDNPHDLLAIKRAWKQHQIPNALHLFENGESCMDFLLHRGPYSEGLNAPAPGLAILDIKLPKNDGLSLLQQIRQSDHYAFLPVVIFTTSAVEADRQKSYVLGANAFIRKPMGYQAFSDALMKICTFWNLVELPGGLE